MSSMRPFELCLAIKHSIKDIDVLYTYGGCYEFYKILKTAFPDAVPHYSKQEDHVYTLIEGEFYDIHGMKTTFNLPSDIRLMTHEDQQAANSWKNKIDISSVTRPELYETPTLETKDTQ